MAGTKSDRPFLDHYGDPGLDRAGQPEDSITGKNILACVAEQWFEMKEQREQFSTVVVGLGKTGLSCARYLKEQGVSFVVTDSRTEPPMLSELRNEMPEVKLITGGLDEELLVNADEIILSPGISMQEPSVKSAFEKGVSVIGDVELFCRVATAPILAITGSNGKSTVVSIVAEMLKAAGRSVGLGGNIGTPVLDLLQEEEPDAYVLELSSFQLETVFSLNAKAAVVLNISEDHMDRYSDLMAYAEVKSRIYAGTDLMVLNLDDDYINKLANKNRETRYYGSKKPEGNNLGLDEQNGRLCLMEGQRVLLSTDEMKIRGEHNYLNALAAIALGQSINLSEDAMMHALRSFKGLPHRCEWVSNLNGVTWYNDSKGTNVGATCAAINSLSTHKNLILIAGGEGKDADFSPLAKVAPGNIKTVITIGRDGPVIESVLKEIVPVESASNLQIAVALAFAVGEPGDVVLLSPACASFDMFRDYQERGRVFAHAVQDLRVC